MKQELIDNDSRFGQGVILRSASVDADEEVELKEAYAAYTKAAPDSFNKDRVLTFIASDETPDRAGDVVRVDGGDIKRFMSNPVFLVQHYGLPVARVLSMKKISNSESSPNGKAWIAKVYFPEGDEDGEEIYSKFKNGIMSAVSIGFRSKKINNPESEEERKQLGLGRWGHEILEWEMLELSAAAIPCNPNALMVKSFASGNEAQKILNAIESLDAKVSALEAKEAKRTQVSAKEWFMKNPITINL